MLTIDDVISYERMPHNGVYVFTAPVIDPVDSLEFYYNLSFYFYDEKEIDIMKEAFISSVLEKGYTFSLTDEVFDD